MSAVTSGWLCRRSPQLFAAAQWLVLVGWSATAQGQSQLPLLVEVEYPSNVSRTCGPIRLQLNFDWGGAGVFHGALQLVARDSSRELIGTYVVDHLYLTEGRQSHEIMLPGFRVGTFDDAITLSPTLMAADSGKVWQLNDLQVLVPGDQQRELVVAILAPETTIQSRSENDIVDSLRLERLAPPGPDEPRLLTKMVDWRAEDAPQDPLRYCACDILLLPDEGLKLLQQPHLDALLAWVRAGGGVCFLSGDAELESEHVAFLNALVGAVGDSPTFLRDSQGRLVHELDESAETAVRTPVGLGRAVIVLGPDQAHPRAPHWTGTAAFLWRVKQAHLETVNADGFWNWQFALDAAKTATQLGNTSYGNLEAAQAMLAANYQPLPTIGLAPLIQRLLPEGIRLVPLSTMGLLLLAYLMAIGPLDYFILGKLGMRKWTWCTFPAITLVFTGFSIGLSNSSMSASVTRRAAVLRDMTAGGALARENRLELLFPSASGVMTTDVGRGLFMPTRFQEFAQLQSGYMDYRTMQVLQEQRSEPAAFQGRMPTQCTVLQRVSQWTPQFNRMLAIPLQQPADLPEFDWDTVPEFRSPAGLQQLRERISRSFSVSVADRLRRGLTEPVSAGLFHAGESIPLLGDSTLFLSQSDQMVLTNTPYGQQWVKQPDSYLRLLSAANQPGFLGVVSGYAPTGGDRFEDLLMLDPTDPRQWLLVVVLPQGDDLLIYRRLYVLND